MATALPCKDKSVQSIIDGIYRWVNPNPHVNFICDHAEFASPVDIRIDGQQTTATKSIIATGSRTAEVQIPGLGDF